MKQLSRNEVVELVAKAMYGTWATDKFDDLSEYRKDIWAFQAKAALQALETNGILCLVEGEAKEGDLIKSKIYEDSPETLGKTYRYDEFKVFNGVKQRRSKLWEEEEFDKIIQRNSIPAYHCKSETQEAE